MSRHLSMTIVLALLFTVVGCSSKKEGTRETEPQTAAPEGVETGPGAEGDTAEAATVDAQPPAPVVQIPTVTPVELPAEWPKFAKVDDIPEDVFADILTKSENGRPSVFTLKHDVVLQNYPCLAGKRISIYVNSDAIAGCTLALDYAVVPGVDLAKGTDIKTQPSGDFTGFVLKAPQMVLDVPVVPNQTIYWTKSSGLGTVTLAANAKLLGLDFQAGTKITFRSNTRMLSLQSATLKGEHVFEGQSYADGLELEFDTDNKVVKAE